MSSQMAEAIQQLTQDKGISEDLIKKMIENALVAAYKKKFGTDENAVVKFADDLSDVSIYSRKVIVDGVYDPVVEIELEDALKLSEDCEIGDEIDILVDPKEFDRVSIQTGKQTAHQRLRDIQKDSLYVEFKDKVGEIITGTYQRERNGNIYVDVGRIEAILPKKFQSPREVYTKNDRIRALVKEIRKNTTGLQLVLSRTDPDFVRRILELEVPEIYDKTIEIVKIVREPGYRTKIAVTSTKDEVDPVGACVGQKGVRIQNVIHELEGEKIDVLKYDPDPAVFIQNALSPAEVLDVIILDKTKKQALAVVNESQFSLAIGKQGLNVRLANKLADWNIDVKTEDQCEEIEALSAEARKAADELFNTEEIEINKIEDLPNVDINVAEILKAHGIEKIEDYLDAYDKGEIAKIEGLSEEKIAELQSIIESVVEIVEEQPQDEEYEQASEEEETYVCPECGHPITTDMTKCPNYGVELSFEYEDEE